MKKINLLLFVGAFLMVSFSLMNNANAQLLIEDFDYTIGSTLVSNGWAAHSGTDNPVSVTTGLTFPGYAGSGIGGAAALVNNYQDVNKTFAPVSSGVVYMAFLFQTGATNSAGYFMHFDDNSSASAFVSRLFVDATGSTIGINNTSSTPATTLPITPGVTYLGVVEYSFTTGYSNLYVFDSFPTSQPTTGFVSSSSSSISTDIDKVCLRQYNASEDVIIDGIRIATSWSDAVAAANSNAVATPTFSLPSGILYSTQSLAINCSTVGATIRYTTDGTDPIETSTEYTTPISISANTTVKAKAWLTGMTESSINTAVYSFPIEVANIAAFLSANTTTSSTVYEISNDVTVVFQSGSNTYLQDASGAIVVYSSLFPTLNNGDVISGGIFGSCTYYNNLPEFIPTIAPTTYTSGTPVQPIVLTMDALLNNSSQYMSQLVKLEGVTFPTDTFGTENAGNINITQGASSMVCRNQYNTITDFITSDDLTYDVTGMVVIYGTTLQIAPRNVSDIEVAASLPSLVINTPIESAVYTSILDSFYFDITIDNFVLGTDGYLKAESSLLPQFGLTNPAYLTAPLLTSLLNTPISLPAGNYSITFSLTDLIQQPLNPAVSVTRNVSFQSPTLSAPVFDIPGGNYHQSTTVEVSSPIAGATLYYTLDGSEPTTNSQSSTSPLTLTITSTTTIKAIAVLNGWNNSPVATATYTIIYDPDLTVTPDTIMFFEMNAVDTFFVTGHHLTESISLTSSSTDYTISPNTLSSSASNAPVVVTFIGENPSTAFITITSGTASQTVALTSMLTVADPVLDPATAVSTDSIIVSMTCATSGASIYYTTDGTLPTASATLYNTPIVITQTTTINAIATKNSWTNSDMVSGTYTINLPEPPAPDDTLLYQSGFEAEEGFVATTTYNNQTVAFSGNTGEQWGTYFGTPSTTSPVAGSQSMQMRWYASDPTSVAYTYTDFDIHNATRITFAAKSTNDLSVNVSYSIDGGSTFVGDSLFQLSSVNDSYGFFISENGQYTNVRLRFSLSLPATLPTSTSRVYLDSLLVFGYTGIAPVIVSTPVANPSSGNYYTPQTVELTCATDSATIRYTTDGTTPNINSTTYTAPITISTTTTLKAVAWKAGLEQSNVMTATYSFPIEVANIAAFLAANATPTNSIYKITGDLTYVFKNGGNTYVQDSTGGLLVYDNNTIITTQYVEGDVISGGLCGRYTQYNGLTEMVPTLNTAAATVNTGTVIPLPATVFEVGENYAAFESRLVKFDNVIFSAGSFNTAQATNINFMQGDETMVCRNQFKTLDLQIPEGFQANLTGFVLIYGNTIQIAPRSNNDIEGIQLEQVATPTFTPEAGNYQITTEPLLVTIASATPDATIYYSIDGSTPSIPYTTPIELLNTTTVNAIAVKEGMTDSEIATAEFFIENENGIENFIGSYISVYPNPVLDVLTINAKDVKVSMIELYSSCGQLIYTQMVNGENATIDFSEYSNGLYFLTVSGEKSKTTIKIVKK